MIVKELKAKYPGYMVVEQGYPDSFPFSEIPSGNTDNCEVKGYEVHNKEFTSVDITAALFGGRKKPNKTYKGHLYIYLKGNKPRR